MGCRSRCHLLTVALAAGLALAAAVAAAAGNGQLGVAVTEPTPPRRGALIARVAPDSAAERAGLRVQDMVVAADSQPISSASDLTVYVTSHRAGDRIALTVMRWNGTSLGRVQLVATLGEVPAEGSRATAGAPQDSPTPPRHTAPAIASATPPAHADPAPGLNNVSWTRFTDPYESAFTIDVPRGWKVAGGVVRKTTFVPNLVLRVLSPDHRTLIALGDPDAAPYNAPLAARDFVRRFTDRAMSGACLGLSIDKVSDLPDVVRYASANSLGPYNQWSAAQAVFTCKGDRQAGMSGEAIAVLQYMTTLRSGHAQILAAFVTTAGQQDAADKLLNQMIVSLHQNEDWTARQQQIAQQLGDGAMARWHAEQRQFQQVDDAITNTAHFVGADGRRYDLDSRPRYQWRAPDGHTAGTDTPTPPSPGSTLLERQPEQPP